MNNVINKFLLVVDKFMPEMHLRQPQFTYSACGSFTKHKQGIFKEKKLVIQTIYTKMNWIKLVLLMMLRVLIVKIL